MSDSSQHRRVSDDFAQAEGEPSRSWFEILLVVMIALMFLSSCSRWTSGQVYLKKDGGETWRIQALFGGDGVDYSDVWFVDPKHGWITGTQVLVAGESVRPLLFETLDGGELWKQLSVDANTLPTSVGRDTLFRTEDNGKTWKRALSLPPAKDANVALRTLRDNLKLCDASNCGANNRVEWRLRDKFPRILFL